MSEARLIRVARFRATHRYHRPEWSDEQNRRTFGSQTEPHAHDWRVEVHVRGTIDPSTGWVVDLAALDGVLRSLLGAWDGGDLNALIPEVAAGRVMPSTEVLAEWIYERLAPRMLGGARLAEVRVFESDELGAAYPA